MGAYIAGEDVSRFYPNVSISIERITPDVAEKMLTMNTRNRDPKKEPLARAIVNGEWHLNGASIVFSDDGILLDGQNRLMACIKTGIPIDSVVVRGISTVAQTTMDVGVKRGVTDYLKMHGYPNYTLLGSIGSSVMRADVIGIDGSVNVHGTGTLTVMEVCRFVDANYNGRLRRLVSPVQRTMKRFKGVHSITIAPLYDRFVSVSEDDFDGFVERLLSSDSSCTAIKLLSDRLDSNARETTGKLTQRVISALFIKAWNAYMMGADVKALRFRQGGNSPEAFPKIFEVVE